MLYNKLIKIIDEIEQLKKELVCTPEDTELNKKISKLYDQRVVIKLMLSH